MKGFNLKELVLLTISSFLTAIAVQFFFKEYSLTPGGITGLSIVISWCTKIPIDIVSLGISIPLLIISTVVFGKKFAFKTVYVIFTIPLFLRIIPQISFESNVFYSIVFGGFLVGFSISIALYLNCATGGSDTLALLFNKAFKMIDVDVFIIIIDTLIVLSSFVISKKIITSLYSFLTLIVIVVTIRIFNKIFKGVDYGKTIKWFDFRRK